MFGGPSSSSGSMSVFGSTTGSGYNPFAVGASGKASSTSLPFQTNPSPFSVNSASSTSSPFQTNPNPFAINTFGNANSTSSPFQTNQFAVNGGASSGGSPFQTNPNQFAVNGSSSGGSPFLTNPSPFAVNTVGNGTSSSSPFQTNHNPFAVNTTSRSTYQSSTSQSPFANNPFGNPSSSSSQNLFAVNTTGNASFQSSPSLTSSNPFALNTMGDASSSSSQSQTPFFGRSSTGIFGTQSSSTMSSPFTFGLAGISSGTSGSSAASGITNNGFRSVLAGNAPISFSQSTGSSQTSNSISAVNPFATSTLGSSGSAIFGANSFATNGGSLGFGRSTIGSQQSSFNTYNSQPAPNYSFSVTQAPLGQNKGSKVSPYAATKVTEAGSLYTLLSISGMQKFETKSHEELRWEDYELKSGVAPSWNGTPSTTTTPVVSQPAPLFQLPPPSSPAAPWSTIPSTTTPLMSQPSPIPQNPFPSSGLPWNTTPSTNTTPVASQPPAFPQIPFNSSSWNTTPSNPPIQFSSGLAPSSNPIPSTTSSPWSTQPSSLQFRPSTPVAPSIPSFPPIFPHQPLPNLSANASTGIYGDKILDLSQPSHPQQFPSADKAADCIIAVKDPFGSQPAPSQPSISPSIFSPATPTGISSMPVADKPVTRRISHLFSSRHISQRPLTIHARKYRPRGDEPKVPFFDEADDKEDTRKASISIVPRENPKAAFVTSFAPVLHEHGGNKAKQDHASSPLPWSPGPPDVAVNVKESLRSVTENCIQFKRPSVPKLLRSDYYTQPSIQALTSLENSDPGVCSHIKGFVVGRHGYGSAKFDGETDVRELDLDALVQFNEKEVVVYADENEKPAVGEGLNKAAEVTLLNLKCTDKTGKQYMSGKMVDKYTEKLKMVAEKQGAEFVSYDAVNGVWKFRVKHFS